MRWSTLAGHDAGRRRRRRRTAPRRPRRSSPPCARGAARPRARSRAAAARAAPAGARSAERRRTVRRCRATPTRASISRRSVSGSGEITHQQGRLGARRRHAGHHDFRQHGIRDEHSLMGETGMSATASGVGRLVAREDDVRIEGDLGDEELAALVLRHHADRTVRIRVDDVRCLAAIDRKVSMWQLDRAATNASSGSTASADRRQRDDGGRGRARHEFRRRRSRRGLG